MLFVVCFLLCVIGYLLVRCCCFCCDLLVLCLLYDVCRMVLVVCCLVIVVCCLLSVLCCLVFGVWCSLVVVCCVLRSVCCVLFDLGPYSLLFTDFCFC